MVAMKRPMHPKSIENLRPIQALDGATDLSVHLAVRVSVETIQQLDKLPGDRSSKVRAALAAYLRGEGAQ